MVFLCFECLRQRRNQNKDTSNFSWLSFLNLKSKGDATVDVGHEHCTQPLDVKTEKCILKDSSKTSFVDIVPQGRGLYRSIAQDSDTESQFSFNSEPDSRRITLFYTPDSATCGTITCSIKFYHFANRFVVRVNEVKLNLLENITVNPYVKLHLVPEFKRYNRQTTRVKRNSTSFVCNEDFLFSVGSREVRTKCLCLQVFDYKANTRHLCIGKVNINLKDFDFKDEEKPLSLKYHILPYRENQDHFGSLKLAICVNPESLRIGLLQAENITPVDMSGRIDPYCRVLVYVGSELLHKKKTAIADHTFNPVWKEYITLDLPPNTVLCDVSINIEVRDYVRNIKSTSYLLAGRVTLSNTAGGTSQTLWEHACSKRGSTITEWQPIGP